MRKGGQEEENDGQKEMDKREYEDDQAGSLEYPVCHLGAGNLFFLAWNIFYSSCPFVMITGFPCPGCGLSRAGFSILRGEFLQAWYLHPFIYGIGLLTAVFVIRRYILHKETGSLKKWLIFLLAGMFVFYIYRMIRYFPGEPPMSYYPGNLLSRIAQAFQVLNR